MINKDECLLLGSIVKPHGTKGSLLLWLRKYKAEDIRKRDSVFVEIDGLLVPFFIELFETSQSDRVILKFEDINSETRAKNFAGYEVYILPDQITRKNKSLNQLTSLKGYKVFDSNTGFVGIAGEVADIVNNPLLQVSHEGHEFLIPVHEDIILKIDNKKKEIRINAPEGLFEL